MTNMSKQLIFHKEFDCVKAPERGSEGAAGIDFFIPMPESIDSNCFNYMHRRCIEACADEDHKMTVEKFFNGLKDSNNSKSAFWEAVIMYNRVIFGKDVEQLDVSNGQDVTLAIRPGESVSIPSGISAEIPHGYCLTALNKSGIAVKNSLLVGAQLIDEDYTGVIHIDMHNCGKKTQYLKCGQKIIQCVLMKTWYDEISIACEDSGNTVKTARGEGGFGSTGV